MKDRPDCVITGCWLVLSNEDCRIWGDLHRLNDMFIFNACLSHDNRIDAAREFGVNCTETFNGPRPAVDVDVNCAYEKRGVFVFPVDRTDINEAAKAKLNDWSPL